MNNLKALKREKLLDLIEIQNTDNFRKTSAISSHNINQSCYDLAKIPFTIVRQPHKRNWSAYNFHKLEDGIKDSHSYV